MPDEQVTFKEGGVTVTLKITQEQGEARCTLLLDIEGVLGDPYATISPCTVGSGTRVAAAISDATRVLPHAVRVLMAMGEREAGLATLVVSHQILEYAAILLRHSITRS